MIFQALILFLCYSCGAPQQENKEKTEQQQVDKFYTSEKDGDLYRIPLIKPIQIISPIGYDDSWDLKFPYQKIERKRSVEVSSATVVDSLIIVYSKMTSLPGEMTQAWFFIDTRNKTEIVCRNNDEYQKHLSEIGIATPILYDVNELYSQFKEKGVLPFK
jgi:hypothetical protein